MAAEDDRNPAEIRRALEGFLDILAEEVVRGLVRPDPKSPDSPDPKPPPTEPGRSPKGGRPRRRR